MSSTHETMPQAGLDLSLALGINNGQAAPSGDRGERKLREINLLLVAEGLSPGGEGPGTLADGAQTVLENYQEQRRLLQQHRCPPDRRIEAFLCEHFADLNLDRPPRLPERSLVLPLHGIARELSLPAGGDEFVNSLVSSYRVRNGVLHNPRHDRRTTKGTFHVAEGGLPIPGDKKAVPKRVFAGLLHHAVHPPADLLLLPFTSRNSAPAQTFVSLLLRPMVCPEVPSISPRKTMEVRVFAPGSLVSNLDFLESIFGNSGDPFLPRNDAGLDVEHWTGHSGCIIFAPHLSELTKKGLGLPHHDQASERQRRDGMCWKSESEKYNDGTPFKLTCRTEAGVIVTLIADNYFGYGKKEVKTQISYAANLYGNVEEEHSGGAIAFPSYSLGDEFIPDSRVTTGTTFDDVVRNYGELMDVRPEGYGIDRQYPDLIYIPENARASVNRQEVWWTRDGKEHSVLFSPDKVYMTPSGFHILMEKHPGAPSWRIIGTGGGGVFCHKPCTVSGGGKSEISKSIRDYMLYGPIFVSDIQKDLDWVEQIFDRDYSTRWKPDAPGRPDYAKRASRTILSPERSLGSVIKLLAPSPDYTDAFNAWLASIPSHIYPIVFIIKRFYRPEWDGNWRKFFGVDIVNGYPGHELKLGGRKLAGSYLRVGLMADSSWRTFKLRQDFAAAMKIQTEDDISASLVVPPGRISQMSSRSEERSLKFSANCEYRLFQRPDDAVHRGLDKQTEADLARSDNFLSNFEPLSAVQARNMVERVTEFEQFTPPMRKMLRGAAESGKGYVVSSANARLVDGKPSKNPRYLQTRPDLMNPLMVHVAKRAMRFYRGTPANQPILSPVDSVLIGRRNNPAEPAAGIRGLAVYNPIHYQELPELFMDFICSLTGKSPSTTGAGSEGALTKGPFNALRPIVDLNAALVSYMLTGLGGFSTSAGHIGPNVRMDHDVSLLVPEVWCRLSAQEREASYLMREGYLEPLRDFEHRGQIVLASRLGYRITSRFVQTFFGRVFDNPGKVFDEAILKPETQDLEAFVDGVKNITEAQQRVARRYFEDGSIEDACPPLRALLTIMAEGSFEGKDAADAQIRGMFTREYLLKSVWYHDRLIAKHQRDASLWRRHVKYLDDFISNPANASVAARLGLEERRRRASSELARATTAEYAESLRGTLGIDPSVIPNHVTKE